MNVFVEFSSNRGANILDWWRSIYFSLSGSSALALSLKWGALESLTLILFGVGCVLFFIGLYVSVLVTRRFKGRDAAYELESEEYKEKNSPADYYTDRELKSGIRCLVAIQHSLLWLVWIPAILFIGWAGYRIETEASQSSAASIQTISNISNKVDQISNRQEDLDGLRLELKEAREEVNRLKALSTVIDKNSKAPNPGTSKE